MVSRTSTRSFVGTAEAITHVDRKNRRLVEEPIHSAFDACAPARLRGAGRDSSFGAGCGFVVAGGGGAAMRQVLLQLMHEFPQAHPFVHRG